jgi:hypothetical protein
MLGVFYSVMFVTRMGILPDIDAKGTAINTMPQNCSINRTFSSLTKFYDTSSTDVPIVILSWNNSSRSRQTQSKNTALLSTARQ